MAVLDGSQPGSVEEPGKPIVVCVDDDASNLQALGRVLRARCTVLLASGDPRAAVAYLEQAVRLQSNYPQAQFNLARAYAAVGRAADADRAAALAEAQAAAAGKDDLVAQIRGLRRSPPR